MSGAENAYGCAKGGPFAEEFEKRRAGELAAAGLYSGLAALARDRGDEAGAARLDAAAADELRHAGIYALLLGAPDADLAGTLARVAPLEAAAEAALGELAGKLGAAGLDAAAALVAGIAADEARHGKAMAELAGRV